jgi:DNA-binding NarL/FixJ family response regulator
MNEFSPSAKRKEIKPHDALTERETQVLELIVQGMTNRQIGQALNLSHKTIEYHRTNLMQKLGIHSVAELVRYAISQNLVEK